jgi:hypothetical protein
MRRLLVAAASVFLMTLSATPGMAKPYPWCARSLMNGGSVECRYITLAACQATVNGLGGDCVQNPVILFNQQQGSRRNKPPKDAGWQGGGWDDGSNKKRTW